MSKEGMSIESLLVDVHSTAVAKGWWPEEPTSSIFPEKLLLVHSEISEAVEDYREHGLEERSVCLKRISSTNGEPKGIAVELADAIIRILDLCAAFNIPIVEALRVKLEYNKTRPYRHGGKRC